MEPEFQVVQTKGAASFAGGNFQPYSNNRFIIRRGRLQTNYTALNKLGQKVAEMRFEVDGTQKGLNINEFWGKIYENKWQLFSFVAGMVSRPFSYEINAPTRQLESPERARMSLTLMRGEVDLGAMAIFEPNRKTSFLKYLKISAGIFNGEGLTGTTEFDSFKDFAARAFIKPVPIGKSLLASGGFSTLQGGLVSTSRYIYSYAKAGANTKLITDSSASNIGSKAPRQYYGMEGQLKYLFSKTSSLELRAEYWWGKQSATAASSETPSSQLQEPVYTRNFNGAIFYLLHRINAKNLLALKYDWYDPNTMLKSNEISKSNQGESAADIKYSTLGIGYMYNWSANLKLHLWYEFVKNEATQISGYTGDVKDNVLTMRIQFSF